MPFDTSGVYYLPSPAYPAIAGTSISPDYYNEILEDIAAALTTLLGPEDLTTLNTAIAAKAALAGASFTGFALTTPVSVAFSATPTFDAALSNIFYFGGLTANVTDVTVSNPKDGQTLNIRFPQTTGGHTITLGSEFKVSGVYGTAAGATTWLNVTYVATAARWEGAWMQVPA